jgi:YVTN family beta-propeller protein
MRKNKPTLSGVLVLGILPLIAGCAMDHGSMGTPGSDPIAPIGSEALFVVNGGSNSLTAILVGTNTVAGTIALKNAPFPHHVSLSPDNALLALAVPGMDLSGGHGGGGHAMAGTVLTLDATTGETKASRRFDYPNHNASFSPDGKEIWTSQMATQGKVLVLDAGTLATKQTLDVGDSPAEVTFTVDGKYAFVANGKSNSVSIFDASSKALAKTITVGTDPVGAWPGRDTLMYVDNESNQTITAIHGGTLEVVRTYVLGFTPGMAATAPSGDLWVTDSDNGKVVLFPAGSSVKSGEVTAGAGAHGIAFSRDGKTVFISNQAAGTVSVIDVGTLAVKGTLTVGEKPNGMVIR